ncbi:bifunctional helix-turn-helix transcriptional regulator/GNAT family N-acetyltransferase [Chitinophaga barathri]|uniref:GNAT family N-acetyltransferase n=1 Tax=Chitinophaga barathri TaxID=1647451 RepID=A0A3N4N547_9BACT|nr:helix-turn-helix domain-containing GNAT family N-acetyltransferase [Chitinophaga barathri]RPD42753.1 GNAT family N-acetyltransferase [Chitinophaga barathri]
MLQETITAKEPIISQEAALIAGIRKFNRYYTSQLGLLQQHIFDSEYSLTDVRVLYEVQFNGKTTATGIREALGIDPGYLSRILRKFEKQGLVIKHPLPEDGRSSHLTLTARGEKLMRTMNELSDNQIRQMLENLAPEEQTKTGEAMRQLRYLLKAPGGAPRLEDVEIRHDLRPGDLGNIVRLHGEVYAKEYGYNIEFEQYVMETIGEFMKAYDPAKDRVWLASCFGEIIGMIAIIHRPDRQGQLRWFLLRPDFRGIGLGRALMDKAMEFCRQQQFKEVYLLTTNQQGTAASIYTKHGFMKTASVPETLWGQDLYEERYVRKM